MTFRGGELVGRRRRGREVGLKDVIEPDACDPLVRNRYDGSLASARKSQQALQVSEASPAHAVVEGGGTTTTSPARR